MSLPAKDGPKWRSSPFAKSSLSNSTGPVEKKSRPVSAILSSASSSPFGGHIHTRTQSFSPTNSVQDGISRKRSNSYRHSVNLTSTFAPTFIQSEEMQAPLPTINGIEGENDFSGKRYVWIKDPETAFSKAWVTEDLPNGRLLIQTEDGAQRDIDSTEADKVNPAKFDKSDDMAELTHLNEASVVHNLHMRYQADLIYTYSGLFLVAVNPYCSLPIYSRDYINMYTGRNREDTKPHIFAVADEAFRNLVDEGQNQSILVTGESGAGKTENTKKVIQYLAAVATTDTPRAAKSGGKHLSSLSEQILRANPILEAFGNAQTVRNNNSSRFGKFIRIEFMRSGQIAGAFIDWYLLEKSRVVKLNSRERNYHIFYQLLRGATHQMKRDWHLLDQDVEDFQYTRQGNDTISGVSDHEEWNSLIEAFHIMGFSEQEQSSILKTVAIVLHLGNINVTKESVRADQASFSTDSIRQAGIVAQLLGISADDFITALLHPKVKAGHEWVEKVQTPEQVKFAIDALAKGIYERQFGDLVTRINHQLNRSGGVGDDSNFIGVLDIAGFEIFQQNSFEQLCINFTNEKLQQFFNHHMFVLEQEEYAREQIEWKFIDFGKDLQPTIDLIELSNPIGIFSCLDEDCVMPKATDVTFTQKLHSLWDRKTPKYKASLRSNGFILTHYAAEVEYSTDDWLEKNKDPLNDNVTRLLATSKDRYVSHLFADCGDVEGDPTSAKSRVKKGLFRTVAQRHKEQLSTLMNQLHSTHPHFVRCIIPNHKKKPKQFTAPLVLDQLRCNGVLEGIRIARTGFPNRLTFTEFRARYEVLCSNLPKTYLEGQVAVKLMLEKFAMDTSFYRVGLTKVFFRAGVLADLEERRDALISDIFTRFQAVSRGFVQRRAAHKRLYRSEATRVIQRNFQVYLQLQANPWWRLFIRMKPLLGASRQAAEVKRRDDAIAKLHEKMDIEAKEKQRLEDDKRRAEIEISKVQHTLESERALALDKEEIFKRLQSREAQLSEELASALQDLDKLEEELDAVVLAQKKAEEDARSWRKELESASSLIHNAEAEKRQLSDQINQLDRQMMELEVSKSQRSEQEEALTQEIKMLQSHVLLKDRKLQDIEAKLLQSSQDVDIKLAASSKELNAARKQVRDLQDENKHVRQQLTDLSSTSTSFEDLIRQKESEMALLKIDLKKHSSDRQAFESERRSLTTKHDSIQSRLRDIQGEFESMKIQKMQAERDAIETKKQLEKRITDDEGRKVLEKQVDELRKQLREVQTDLTRERQSRDDVEMLGEHKYNDLKRNYDSLTEAKITIEKELYTQQDILRRTTEAKATAEADRKDFQNELRRLREQHIVLQEKNIEVQNEAESRVVKAANERQATLRRDLDAKIKQIDELRIENTRLSDELNGLIREMANADIFKSQNDSEKERLAREVTTLRGRLTASENDNRALLNKIQQKNLDIARSNSRVGEASRSRVVQLSGEKNKLNDDNKNLQRCLEEAQLTISSLEKQKEKLALNVEDLTHEINREHKTSRNAEKLSSTSNLQLAESNRKLETERQLRNQAQANARTIQISLEQANSELSECRHQLMALKKVFDPNDKVGITYESSKQRIANHVDLALRLEASQQALRVANDRNASMEAQVKDLRNRHGEELVELESKHTDSKRALLEEMSGPQINSRNSPAPFRGVAETRKVFSPGTTTPRGHTRMISDVANDSARSDRTVDTITHSNRMDLQAEIELLQNKLEMSEMRNRHLQSQVDRSSPVKNWEEESPSARRMQKLERENVRLHEKLDDSSQRVSVLERNLHTGQLTLKEVQTKSHEELCDFINSQQRDRVSLHQAYTTALNDVADAKTSFDDLKNHKSKLEVELRDAKAHVANIEAEREQESASHSQLLQEFSDLQIRLDSETSQVDDVTASLNLYKARADSYFKQLEQAEIAVLKATKAEEFAKSRAKETDDYSAQMMAERKSLDTTIEDMQRQTQKYEERIEDLSADLEGALQAKRRLQNELEDYRSQRATAIEDKEISFEQTRKKYQSEFSTLNNELDIERENVIHEREENSRLRDEIEELRSKWDDEVLNSTSWSKEKRRLEVMAQELIASRDEALSAHNDAQGRAVTLLSQNRELRDNVMRLETERDSANKEKANIELRMQETLERIDELARSESPAVRNLASVDKELLELKSNLAQQLDINDAAIGKMRRSDSLAQEAQNELQTQRETNVELLREKAMLERSLKDVQLKLVDYETKSYSSASQDVKFLHGRIQELEKSLETIESTRATEARSKRTDDRTLKDLHAQIERRTKLASTLEEDLARQRDKNTALLQQIQDLQASDSEHQLALRRAERDARDDKEKCLRLEREVEGWKGLRFERGSRASVRVPSGGAFSALSGAGGASASGNAASPLLGNGMSVGGGPGAAAIASVVRARREGSAVPSLGTEREGSPALDAKRLSRTLTNTKGFL